MPGPSGVIGEVTGIVATGNVGLTDMGSSASWRRAQFYFETTAITRTSGTFTAELRYVTSDGTVIPIAITAAISAIGIVPLVIDAAFANAQDVVPDGSEIRITLTGDATAVAGKLYRFAA